MIEKIATLPDFYSTSGCRDLILHEQEHRFTIHPLAGLHQSHGLEFLGFLLSKAVKDKYRGLNPKVQAMTSLEHWQRFEEAYPDTSIHMYQFWTRKFSES